MSRAALTSRTMRTQWLCTLLLAFVPLCVHAAYYCTGLMTQPAIIEGDVYVHGTACIIRGVRIGGVVSVRDGGVLQTDSSTYIEGSIHGEGHGNIFLEGSTKLIGDVALNNPLPGAVFIIGPHAHINKVGVMGPADILVRGHTGALSVEWGANVVIAGGSIGAGGLLFEGGNGTLALCGANVGGMKIAELKGRVLAWARPHCPPSNITGSFLVEKGAGPVIIVRNSLDAGDLSVVEQDGPLRIEDTVVGDMGLSDISGEIHLKRLVADSDGIISGALKGVHIVDSEINGDFLVGQNTGDVIIENSKIGGDVSIEGTYGNVVVRDNIANYARMGISRTMGMVNFIKNHQLSISIVENMDVNFFHNYDIRTCAIEKNTGTINIKENFIGSLRCRGNKEMGVFSRNSIAGLRNGQCRI